MHPHLKYNNFIQMVKKENKIYVVKNGRVPGFYKTWNECKNQVNRFSNAKFKSFKDKEEAW